MNEQDYVRLQKVYTDIKNSPFDKYDFYSEDIDKVKFADLDSDIPTDTVNITNSTQIPSEIFVHYAAAKLKCTYGCLTRLQKFYTAIDNKLFIWQVDSNEVSNTLYESNADLIIDVCECQIQITDREYALCIAISTPKYIKIVSCIDGKIDFEQFNIIETSFISSSMCEGPLGYLFCGSYDGDIYTITLGSQKSFYTRTTGIIFRLFHGLIGYVKAPILGLSTSADKDELCYWTDDNSVYFMKFDPENAKFTKLGSKSIDEKIVSASCVGNSYFEVFTQKGERYIFHGTKVKKIEAIKDFNENIKFAESTMGCVVLVGETKAAFIRTQRISGSEPDNGAYCGFKTTISLPGTPVFLKFGLRPLATTRGDSLYWQHTCTPPTAFIITTAGGIVANFVAPYEKIRRVSTQSPDEFLKNLDIEDLNKNSDMVNEIISSLVALCSFAPDLRQHYLYQATKIIRKSEKFTFKAAVLTRLARLLACLNGKIVLEEVERLHRRRQTKFRVTMPWRTLPAGLAIQLSDLQSTIREYDNALQHNLENPNSKENDDNLKISKLKCGEHDELKDVLLFIDFILEVIRVISTFAQQKSSTITAVIEDIKEDGKPGESYYEAVNFLTSTPPIDIENCPSCETISYYLKTFTQKFFTFVDRTSDTDTLAARLSNSAPGILNFADSQISNEINNLAIALSIPDVEQKNLMIHQSMQTFLTYIDRFDQKNFQSIAFALWRNTKMIEPPFELAIAIVHHIDPTGRALKWLKDNQPADHVASALFDRVMQIYSFALSSLDQIPDNDNVEEKFDDCLEKLLPFARRDELFSIALYSTAMERKRLNKLITAGAPFIEQFVKIYAPEHLFRVYLADGRVKEAVESLLKISKESQTRDKKLEYLNYARTICWKNQINDMAKIVETEYHEVMKQSFKPQ